jgi:hypothetical protein
LGLAAYLGGCFGEQVSGCLAAGARRTDTAYPRFLSRSHAADLVVSAAQSGFHGYC